MHKKLLVGFTLLIVCIFSFNLCLANDAKTMVEDASNSVKNVVGGAENVVKNTAEDVSNGAKNVTQSVENGAQNTTNQAGNAMQGTMNDSYNATRTSVDTNAGTGASTFMGMSATAWTWLIMGIAAAAIVALVWYYGSQVRSSNYDDNDRF